MLEIDRPFEGLDEVWIWRAPHPADPAGAPQEKHRASRIGVRHGHALAGLVEIRNRPSRTVLGSVDELHGLGPWSKAELGKVWVTRSSQTRNVSRGVVRSGKVEATWRPNGHFQVGELVERNELGRGGRPAMPNVRDLARSLLRRSGEEPGGPGESDGPTELTAFDRWLAATRHELDDAGVWRIAIDRHPGAPGSVGLGVTLAAIALLHR